MGVVVLGVVAGMQVVYCGLCISVEQCCIVLFSVP